MKKQNRLIDDFLPLIAIVSFFIFFIVSTFFAGFYYNKIVIENQCSSNPLVFAAREYEKLYEGKFNGFGTFQSETYKLSPMIFFNSENTSVRYPN